MKTVKYVPGPKHSLSDETKLRLKSMTDSDIDESDIEDISDIFDKAEREGKLYRPTKTAVYVRIDSDVLAWLKCDGRGYQTRLNKILRDAMLADKGASVGE
jgi:uncharacterized protein (DUF4415 family)